MIGDIMQPTHLLFVLVVALLVLGPKRLPEVGRQLGRGLRDFRAAINGEHVDHHDEVGAESGHVSEVHETPPQPVEHQFAHETTESFAGPSAATGAEEHQTDTGSPDQPVDGGTSGTAGEHEFAYQPAQKPVDPLT